MYQVKQIVVTTLLKPAAGVGNYSKCSAQGKQQFNWCFPDRLVLQYILCFPLTPFLSLNINTVHVNTFTVMWLLPSLSINDSNKICFTWTVTWNNKKHTHCSTLEVGHTFDVCINCKNFIFVYLHRLAGKRKVTHWTQPLIRWLKRPGICADRWVHNTAFSLRLRLFQSGITSEYSAKMWLLYLLGYFQHHIMCSIDGLQNNLIIQYSVQYCKVKGAHVPLWYIAAQLCFLPDVLCSHDRLWWWWF